MATTEPVYAVSADLYHFSPVSDDKPPNKAESVNQIGVKLLQGAVQPMEATPIFGSFKGLNGPFIFGKYAHFSPLRGVYSVRMGKMRCHNANLVSVDPDKILFPLPTLNCRGNGLQPGDNTSAMLEILFPSAAGLKVNDIASHPINRRQWLSPRQIARLLVASIDPRFAGDPKLGVWVITNILLDAADPFRLPTELERRIDEKKRRIIKYKQAMKKNIARSGGDGSWYDVKIEKLKAQIKVLETTVPEGELANITGRGRKEARALATIIYGAYVENRDPPQESIQAEEESTYFDNIWSEMLLVYMWKKHANPKTNLRPYMEEMVAAKIADPSLAAAIIWEGPTSAYEPRNFLNPSGSNIFHRFWPMRDPVRGKPHEEEVKMMRKLLSQVPHLSYGTAHLKFGEQMKASSDCGESLELSTFLRGLWDQHNRCFSGARLIQWREVGHPHLSRKYGWPTVPLAVNPALIHFFTEICRHPEDLEDPKVRDEWAKVMANLSLDKTLPRIHFLNQHEGMRFGLGPGLKNALRALLKLLGDPELTAHANSVEWMLQRICDIFSPDADRADFSLIADLSRYFFKTDFQVRRRWNFKIESFQGVRLVPQDHRLLQLQEKFGQSTARDYVSVSFWEKTSQITQGSRKKLAKTELFSWHCQPTHFDFMSGPRDKVEEQTDVPQISRHGLSEKIFALNLDSAPGKIKAIDLILDAVACGRRIGRLEALVDRWVSPDGEHFANWTDKHTNRALLTILLRYWNTVEFLNRNLRAFYPYLLKNRLEAFDTVDMQLIFDKDLAWLKQADLAQKEVEMHQDNYGVLKQVMKLLISPKMTNALVHAGADDYLHELGKQHLEAAIIERDSYNIETIYY